MEAAERIQPGSPHDARIRGQMQVLEISVSSAVDLDHFRLSAWYARKQALKRSTGKLPGNFRGGTHFEATGD